MERIEPISQYIIWTKVEVTLSWKNDHNQDFLGNFPKSGLYTSLRYRHRKLFMTRKSHFRLYKDIIFKSKFFVSEELKDLFMINLVVTLTWKWSKEELKPNSWE